jgi:hypothetical protein
LVLSRFQYVLKKNEIPAAAAIITENTTNGMTDRRYTISLENNSQFILDSISC